jgi:SAM-dependent methyltransferase
VSAAAPATWDRLAGRYARQERLELRAVDALVRLAAPGPRDRLVDLGSGTGLVLRRMAAAGVRPASAVAVDGSPGMLAAGAWPPWVTPLQADARAVGLPDGCADVVTCAYVLQLHDAPGRREILAQARRLLAGGGRLVVLTPWCDRFTPGGRVLHAAMAGLARRAPGRWGGLAPVDPAPDLDAAGLVVTRRAVLPRGGYPSLVLVASSRRASTSRWATETSTSAPNAQATTAARPGTRHSST